jgi:D-xylose transport system permease protein
MSTQQKATQALAAALPALDETAAPQRRPRWLQVSRLRTSGLIVVIIAVFIAFQILTHGLFLSSRNLTNLGVQGSITAVLAVGVVLVMVTGNIDLSPGSTVAFSGLAAAYASTKMGMSAPLTVIVTLALGMIIGVWQGLWVTVGKVPSFIVTLSSLLAIGGLALALTSGETLPASASMLWIADGTLPNWLTILLSVLLMAGVVAFGYREYSARIAAGMDGSTVQTVVGPIIRMAVIVCAVLYVSLSYQGLPVPVAVVAVVAVALNVAAKHTPFGRRLYAIGGSERAAVLAGIRVSRHVFATFVLQGMLYAVAGMILLAYVASAAPNAESGLELDVITAAVIGGTSLFGGAGTIAGALLGTLLTTSLQNGMQLMNVDSSYESIVIGVVLLVAVLIDIRARQGRASTS